MATLRDFIYLDTARLHSFVSQVQGGLINEVSETTRQLGGLSAGINVGFPPIGGKVDASKGKESERQQIMQFTDPTYFDILHRYLQQNGLIDVTNSSLQTRQGMGIGQFIEVQGIIEPPIVERWVNQFEAVFEFVEKNFGLFSKRTGQSKKGSDVKLSQQQLQEFKGIRDFLLEYIKISRQDPARQYVRVMSANQKYRIWAGLIPNCVIVPLDSVLPGDARILGRVERLLDEGEAWKIVDLGQFTQVEQAGKMLDMLNGFNSLTGRRPISQADLEANFPDIFVTPVAIYR